MKVDYLEIIVGDLCIIEVPDLQLSASSERLELGGLLNNLLLLLGNGLLSLLSAGLQRMSLLEDSHWSAPSLSIFPSLVRAE
jgi:hypothetical protein